MTQIHRGSCLCGAVAFEVAGGFDGFFLCHCSRCRKATGSAHAANLFASTAVLTWLKGEDHVTTFALDGTRHGKSFCMSCGSALPRIQASGRLVVPAGALDTPLPQRPDAHIFVDSRADWDRDLEDVPGFNALP